MEYAESVGFEDTTASMVLIVLVSGSAKFCGDDGCGGSPVIK
jgi:hypothetical protein